MLYQLCKKNLVAVVLLPLFVANFSLASAQKKELVFLNWAEYIDPELVKSFEKQYNVKLKQVYFETDDARTEILVASKGMGYDVVLASTNSIDSYIKNKWIDPIEHEKIPNGKYIDPKWLEMRPSIKEYAVPYLWGTVGIAYRKDLVKKNVESWKDLLSPEDTLKNKVLMIKDVQDTISIAMKYLKIPVENSNSVKSEQYKKIQSLLMAQRPYVKDYSYLVLDKKSSLVTGEIWMAMAYNGDVLTLKEYNPQIEFVVPSEGTIVFMDYLLVMKHSKEKDLAMKFINYLNEPKNAAKLAEYVNFATPNKEARKYLSEDHLQNKIIYPDISKVEKSGIPPKLKPRTRRKFNEIFSKVLN